MRGARKRLLVLLRLLLRRQVFLLLTVAVLFSLGGFAFPTPWVGMLVVAGTALAVTFMLSYFGLLPVATLFWLSTMDQAFVLTLDTSVWYAGRSIFSMLIFAAVILYAFRISLAGRPLFAETPAESTAA